MHRGKTFQARVLKRMVEVGFLDIKTALLVVKQSLHLRVDDIGHGSGLLLPLSSLGKVSEFIFLCPPSYHVLRHQVVVCIVSYGLGCMAAVPG